MATEQKFNYDRGGLTNASVNEYQEDLDFNIETMKGKKVLDIGGGGGKFQKEAEDYGVDVVSIDPAYDFTNVSDEKKNDRQNRLDNYSKRYIKNKIFKEPEEPGFDKWGEWKKRK